ncbi:unnamed protein product [Notodromas monacha]|uniref:PurE domain-containing protein n=1 Tax=Notodromas monacha TaxID=399045 RepID=A0A7R9GA53_9CRUS|nr:unnamed protein product [Notodromas monacha]CAG0914979.1 unnamed protein product [Notodromas monacha]
MPQISKDELLAEGKTKKIYSVKENPELVIVESKDQLTAFGGSKSHELTGKAIIANKTAVRIFHFLRSVGINSHLVEIFGDNAFLARKCTMIPIEFVIRRIATGSFLKRHVTIKEGHRFCPPRVETFFKDDAQNDPEWSFEEVGQLKVKLPNGEFRLDSISYLRQMIEGSRAIFECLEKAWSTKNCVLVDMKIEFGIDDTTGELLLADVIDNDSWRLWPEGDQRLMKDKELYRRMDVVTADGLATVLKNFKWVAEQLETFVPRPICRVILVMGSEADMPFCEKIRMECMNLGVGPVHLHVASAHKTTTATLDLISKYEGDGISTVVIAVAGRSNGLGPVISANSCIPVMNCPPPDEQWSSSDVWSSLRVPSGLGCSTVMFPQTAALQAAQILGLTNAFIWCKVRGRLLQNQLLVFRSDDKILFKGSPEIPAFPFEDAEANQNGN